MEKERGYKVVAIVALLIAVIGVGIGFAAFSATFKVEEAPVTVNPNEKLLANNMKYISTSKFDPENIVTSVGSFKDNNTWGGISFSLNEKSDAITTVQAEIKNESNYDVYLTKIYSTTNGSNTASGMTECVAEQDTNLGTFCSDRGHWFSVSIGYSNIDYVKFSKAENEENLFLEVLREAGLTSVDEIVIDDSVENLEMRPANVDITQEVKISAGKSLFIVMVVAPDYLGRAVTFPDGPFKIYIPEIKVEFSTANPAQAN